MWANIKLLLEFFQAFRWLFKQIRDMTNAYEAKVAEEKRVALNNALATLERAKSDEEKKNALREIAKNTF
jgi:hypothetical protein